MLTANRFTNVVTHSARERLAAAHENRRSISVGERERGAVVAIQTALAELNSDYLPGEGIDGYFGPQTRGAVKEFQRDYGLVVDGIVGRQTMTQLDSLYSPDVVRPPMGVSLHVGVDHYDVGHYGPGMDLNCCANDARAMEQIASQLGYATKVLVDEHATTANLAAFMRSAAANLAAGDSLFLTFSGHGGQVNNMSLDAEADGLDETLCFHDRMLVDDELNLMLAAVAQGVRVHYVVDSCHSETSFKVITEQPDEYREKIEDQLKQSRPYPSQQDASKDADPDAEGKAVPIKTNSLVAATEGERPELQEPPTGDQHHSRELADVFADVQQMRTGGAGKLASGQLIQERSPGNKTLYQAVQDLTAGKPSAPLACTLTALAACRDSEETPAGSPLSLFTANLTIAWSAGYQGSYRDFLDSIRRRSVATATPQLNSDGSFGAQARTRERPFAF